MRIQSNHSKFKGFIIILLLFLLCGLTISACGSSDTPIATPIADQTNETAQNTDNEVAKIAAVILKDDVGEMSLVGDSVSDKKVIIFEESHDSRAGQIEIAIMLVRLHDEYGLKYIALEGTLEKDGPLNASWYHQLADDNTLADIAVQMLREGEINSAELMAMTLPDVTVQGIEVAEEYEVEPGEEAGSAPTLYLFYIALPSLTDDEIAKLNELLEADKVSEAVEFAINTDEWTQRQYERLTDNSSILSAEDLLTIMAEIEAKADEVNAEVEADLKANFQDYKHFFEVASQRSDTMVNNTLALLNEYPDAPIAMIIGAAHTTKVSDLFDKQGISYAVVRPKALATEEPGELSFEAYDRKLQALSVDEEGELGALLDNRKKPPPVLQKRWLQTEAEVKVVVAKIARTVAAGAQPPFKEPPYDLQTEFNSYSNVSVNWDSLRIEDGQVICSLDVQIDDSGKTKQIWTRAVKMDETDQTTSSATGMTLEQLLLAALEDVRSKSSLETEEQASYDNENPATTRITIDIGAKFSNSKEGVSKPIDITL